MTKDKLLMRLTEIEAHIQQTQANMQQLNANLNVAIGQRNEVNHWLSELTKETQEGT